MKRFLKEFNYLSFFAMLALLALGIVSIWSAGNARSELVFHSMWKSTLSTACVGIGLYFLFALIDYRRFLILFAWPLYGVALAMLIAVLLVGSTI